MKLSLKPEEQKTTVAVRQPAEAGLPAEPDGLPAGPACLSLNARERL
jgi:hypothetical protein